MNLRKWLRLFLATIAIGAAASLVIGVSMQVTDPDYSHLRADEWAYNVLMMVLSGFTMGAFAHMGFFAYLMLNYIARSIFKRPYLWIALQGFVTVFVLVEIAVNVYDTKLPAASYWALPLALAAASLLVAWWKTSETNAGAWIPTLFFLIVVTVLEGIPSFRTALDTGKISSLVYQLAPLFICNTYQIMKLHRVLEPAAGDSGVSAKQA